MEEYRKDEYGGLNFRCLEYDGRADLAANGANSWERDHSCNTRNVTADGKYLVKEDTFGIDGIRVRHIA